MGIERFFIKNNTDVKDPEVRENYGKLSGMVGIFANIFLFSIKLVSGLVFKSVSIIADAVNNLSDAMSSIVTLVGFKLAAKPADEDHPYGHQRIEYISALIVSFLILSIGLELIKTSIQKIINPENTIFTILTAIILIVSTGIKFALYLFNIRIGRKINSGVIKATARDCLNDVIATSAVLLSAVLSHVIKFNLDGYMGVLISLFIIYSGVSLIKDTLDPLLGNAPEKELVASIEDKIKSYSGIVGIHDLMVHNYGPQRCFASVHAEVDAKTDVIKSHELIDEIERDFLEDSNIHLVIHLDPVVLGDEKTNNAKNMIHEIVENIDPVLSMHDFRMVQSSISKLIFDVVVPPEYKVSNAELIGMIKSEVAKRDASFECVITIDRSYISSTK